jgi:hypothetical protein
VCDPNLERVDLFASLVQTVEDSLGVRERAIVAAVEAHEREYLPEQVSGNRRSPPSGSIMPGRGFRTSATRLPRRERLLIVARPSPPVLSTGCRRVEWRLW